MKPLLGLSGAGSRIIERHLARSQRPPAGTMGDCGRERQRSVSPQITGPGGLVRGEGHGAEEVIDRRPQVTLSEHRERSIVQRARSRVQQYPPTPAGGQVSCRLYSLKGKSINKSPSWPHLGSVKKTHSKDREEISAINGNHTALQGP